VRAAPDPGFAETRTGPPDAAPAVFVAALRAEVARHRAVDHPFLRRFARGGLARWQLWAYASQHYRLVCFFTAYLEALAHATPDAELRGWVREILEEEYMRPRGFERSHPALYRRFMRALGFADGEWDTVPALPATHAFIQLHLDMTLRSWLETLGAVGPGHEWAIPQMFPFLVEGIERSVALESEALEYFRVHIALDVKHGAMLERGLLRWSVDAQHRDELRRGARRSLDARAALWDALAEALFGAA